MKERECVIETRIERERVCMLERGREGVHVKEEKRESVCGCDGGERKRGLLCVCVKERERVRVGECTCVRERKIERRSVCVKVRERQRGVCVFGEREKDIGRECACV